MKTLKSFAVILLIGFVSLAMMPNEFVGKDYVHFQNEYLGGEVCACNPTADSLALVELYQTTEGETWKQAWDLSSPMAGWFGVQLNQNGCVKCLDLDGNPDCSAAKSGGNNLQGNLIDLNLPYLEHLFLAGNKLDGEIPDFSHMPYLLTLQLCCNRFTGSIPDFSNFRMLNSLELDYNKLTGPLPDFSSLSQVENLYISNNKLSGKMPTLANMPKLMRFYFQNNQVGGELPDFKNNMAIQRIIGFNNQLTGAISDLSMHTYLTHLNLSNNHLDGELPDLGASFYLRSLMVGHNMLKGELPDLSGLTNLIEIDLSHNSLEGSIPDLSKSQNLKTVAMNYNRFTKCPKINMPQLSFFSVADNALTFEDLENSQAMLKDLERYEKQEVVIEDTLVQLELGQAFDLVLAFDKKVKSNSYEWFKDSKKLETEEKGNSLQFKKIREVHEGTYYCHITNPGFPGMTIKSQKFHLQILRDTLANEVIPFANDDFFQFENSESDYTLDLIENDELEGVNLWNIEFLQNPEVGNLEETEPGIYQLKTPPGFAGNLQIEYELCNATDELLCSVASMTIEIEKEEKEPIDIMIPEGISPNNDGVNDLFVIPILRDTPEQYLDNELVIYDKRGRIVFKASPYHNDWDGTYYRNGSILPQDTYFYSVKLANQSGMIKQGTISLRR